MTNNSQVLQDLKNSLTSRANENATIINETTKAYLETLTNNLTSEYKQRLDSIQNSINEAHEKALARIYKDANPLWIKAKTLALAFLCGMLTMLILSLIVYFMRISPYQVSKKNTIEHQSGAIYMTFQQEDMKTNREGKLAVPIK